MYINLLNTMVSKILKFGKQKGSSLNFSAHGGWGKEKNLKSAEKSVRPKSFGGEAQAGGQKGRGLGGIPLFLCEIKLRPVPPPA